VPWYVGPVRSAVSLLFIRHLMWSLRRGGTPRALKLFNNLSVVGRAEARGLFYLILRAFYRLLILGCGGFLR